MRLSKNFTYEEFFVSDTFPNLANKMRTRKRDCKALQGSLSQLTIKVMQPVREFVNVPIRITSGFTSQELHNALYRLKIRKTHNSLHLYGICCDFTTWHRHHLDKLKLAFAFIEDELQDEYSQLIYDEQKHYIHVALPFPGHEKITLIQ